jgi:hypothetical protein
MFQDPATLRDDVWYKGKTTTTVTAMKIEYGEKEENLLDSLGISPMTLQCNLMPTRLSLLWNSIHRGMIRLPRDTWSLHTDESTTNRMHSSTFCSERRLDNTRCLLWGYWGVKILDPSVPTYDGTDTHKVGWRVEDSWDVRISAVGWKPKDSKLYGKQSHEGLIYYNELQPHEAKDGLKLNHRVDTSLQASITYSE